MKFFVVLAAFVAIAAAFPSPQSPEASAVVVSNENTNIGVTDYQARYSTSNQIQADEAGELRQGANPELSPSGFFLSKRGSYSYTAPDGQVITVTYVADENGYRAEGAHIPKPLI